MQTEGACSLPGVSIDFNLFVSVMMRAVTRGYVRHEHADFVAEGLRYGFDLGVDVSKMRGKRLYRNYPTALEARAAVTKAVRARVRLQKTYKLFPFAEGDKYLIPYDDWRVFPMGAVPKPMEPGEMRPYSDHTKTGMKAATDLDFFRHTLTALEDIARFLKYMYYMRVSDVDTAFPLLPIRPRLWRYFLFRWYDVDGQGVDFRNAGGDLPHLADGNLHDDVQWLYVHVCGDFGTAALPGTFKIFFSDVTMGMARSELILTVDTKSPVFVDDISLIAALREMLDAEGEALTAFLRRLGIYIKELKDRAAAQVQLALGFWWDSINRTRTLTERKYEAYVEMLTDFEKRRSLTLRERQQVAGRMQRAVMTMPPGAACFLASVYAMMRGLSLPWQSRRTTRQERLDFRALRELLQRNMGRGYFSLDQFEESDMVDTDASKKKRYAGGAYASRCGRYRFWRYGASASRQPIDFLEGDSVVEAVEDLGHLWHRKVVKFRVDNTAFQQSAVKGWSRAERLTMLLRRLFELCVKFECVLLFEWVSTHENSYADALSREGGEETFLQLVAQTDFLRKGVILRRDPRCGQMRQLGDRYSSNNMKDGPRDQAAMNLKLSVPYQRASVFIGLPDDETDEWVGEVMGARLKASSHRSINAALSHWDKAREPHGWPRVIASDDPERGGKMATFVKHMAKDTSIVGSSISNYVWAFRAWLKFQRQLDPVFGVVDWEEFMQAVMVQTWVPAEPRKKVELWWIRGALQRVDLADFVQVQAAHLMLVLLFTFARSESPVAKAYSGEGAFDPSKNLQVKDVRVVPGALHVRLKGIKQDLRMERPEAAGNEDWVVIGDVPGSDFSILKWTQRLFASHGGPRDEEASFYVDKSRRRPYVYNMALADVRALWAKEVGPERAKTCGLHGLRVTGYDSARLGPSGEELAVAHGRWRSTAHRAYARFGGEGSEEVRGLAAVIVDQLVEPDEGHAFPRVRPAQQAAAAAPTAAGNLWPVGPPQPRAPQAGATGTQRPPPGMAAHDDQQTPTSIARKTKIEVFWREERQWFAGLVTSQRRVEAGLESRVLYDATDDRRKAALWHNLDLETWRRIED